MCTSRISVEKTGFDANSWISTPHCAFLRHMCRSSVQTFRTIILFYNSFSTSMIQFIPNFPVNVNLYSLQRSSAQLPVAVRGKVSAIFFPWWLQLLHHFSWYLQSKTVNDKKTNRLDISFCVENKHKVMHRWPRYKISLLAAGFCKHRQFAKIQHLSESPHSPTVKLTVSTTSREQVRLQCVFFCCFFYTICYCRGSQLLRPSLVHLFTGWLASCLSLGRLREMTTHGL